MSFAETCKARIARNGSSKINPTTSLSGKSQLHSSTGKVQIQACSIYPTPMSHMSHPAYGNANIAFAPVPRPAATQPAHCRPPRSFAERENTRAMHSFR